MSEASEVVEGFRETVDRYIGVQVAKANKHHTSWRGMNKEARANGAIYTSLEPSDGRFHMFPFNEGHVWGVSPEGKLRFRKFGRQASLAIVSFDSEPNTLFRRWAVDTAMQMITKDTQRPLSDEQAKAAAVWANNPFLAEEEFSQIATITDEEIEAMTPDLVRIDEEMEQTRRDLEAMQRARARAWAEHKDDVIF